MLSKIKTGALIILSAISAFVVYQTAAIGFSLVIHDVDICYLVTLLVIIVIGGLYASFVLTPFGVVLDKNGRVPKKDWGARITKRYVGMSVATMAVFSLFVVFLSIAFLVDNDTITYTEMTWLHIFMSILLVPIAEELIYRRFLYAELTKINKIVAFVAEILFFALMHEGIAHKILALAGGAILTIIFDRTKSIWTGVLCHMTYNLLIIASSFIPVNNFVAKIILIPVAIGFTVLVYIWFKTPVDYNALKAHNSNKERRKQVRIKGDE